MVAFTMMSCSANNAGRESQVNAPEKGKTEKLHVDMVVATDPEEIRNGIKIAGWTSFSVGLAALVAGTLTQVWTYFDVPGSPENEFNKKIKNKDEIGYSDIQTKADRLRYATMGLFIGGGVLTATGIALLCTGYLYDFSADVEEASYAPKINFNLSPEYQGMSLGWTF